jgi:hypothetical protein
MWKVGLVSAAAIIGVWLLLRFIDAIWNAPLNEDHRYDDE